MDAGSNFIKAVTERIAVHYQAKLDYYEALEMENRCESCRIPVTPENGEYGHLRCRRDIGGGLHCGRYIWCGRTWCTKTYATCSVCWSPRCASCIEKCQFSECQNKICTNCAGSQAICWSSTCSTGNQVCCKVHNNNPRYVLRKNWIILCCDSCETDLNAIYSEAFDCSDCRIYRIERPLCEDCGKFHCPHKNQPGCEQKRQKI